MAQPLTKVIIFRGWDRYTQRFAGHHQYVHPSTDRRFREPICLWSGNGTKRRTLSLRKNLAKWCRNDRSKQYRVVRQILKFALSESAWGRGGGLEFFSGGFRSATASAARRITARTRWAARAYNGLSAQQPELAALLRLPVFLTFQSLTSF
jgi:hypothetical protein